MFKKVALLIATTVFAGSVMAQQAAPAAPMSKPAPTVKMKKAPSQAQLKQREKMKSCNASATGKKGAERKAYMKSCLSN